MAKGINNGANTHPEKRAKGIFNGVKTHPERLVRGSNNKSAKLAHKWIK